MTDEEIKVALELGVQIAASAIDAESGEPIKENLYAITNRTQHVDWDQKKNGTLVSPVFAKEKCLFRLVEIKDGVATRFSDLMAVDETKTSRQLFRNVKLRKAITVRGNWMRRFRVQSETELCRLVR